jgi:hypothetical protein
LIENHDPLGLVGAAKGTAPLNYNDTNVAYEIPPFLMQMGMVTWRNVLRKIILFSHGEITIVDI